MSKAFSVAMAIVVSTTMIAERTLGTVICQNRRMPVAPSTLAASIVSSGIALMAADSTVIAKPVWIQTMTMMR